MTHHNLVKLVNEEPCLINYFWFFIFTLLTIAEFFRIYLDSMSVYQKFKVRKLVSTRYDLNQPVYQVFVPQIDLICQQYQYGQEYYNYVNQGYDLQLPTEEELEAAKQYQSKIPDYKISSGGGQFHAGVIEDNPGYCSYNPNEAPAEFAAVGGDVALSSEQLNSNGGPPPNYNQPGFQYDVNQNQQYSDNTPKELSYMPPCS